MSNPAAMSDSAHVAPPPRNASPADPLHGLFDRLADHLAPLFVTDPADLPTGRIIAARTIASYRPETQADFINVGRTISFSMSALATLSRTASQEMPPALQLRYLARANALNRSADQSERAIERRRRFQQATMPSADTAWMAPASAELTAEPGTAPAEPADTALDEAVIQAAVAEAMRDYAATWTSAATPPAASEDDPPSPQPKAASTRAPPNAIQTQAPCGQPTSHQPAPGPPPQAPSMPAASSAVPAHVIPGEGRGPETGRVEGKQKPAFQSPRPAPRAYVAAGNTTDMLRPATPSSQHLAGLPGG